MASLPCVCHEELKAYPAPRFRGEAHKPNARGRDGLNFNILSTRWPLTKHRISPSLFVLALHVSTPVLSIDPALAFSAKILPQATSWVSLCRPCFMFSFAYQILAQCVRL